MTSLGNYLRFFRKREALLLAARKASIYSNVRCRVDIEALQLRLFNEVWADATDNVPYYAQILSEHRLPRVLKSLSELELFPQLTREILQANPDLFKRSSPPQSVMKTGGTTGVPLSFGTMKGESVETTANQMIGRFRFGVDFGAKTYLIWGHSHLFGQFPGRWIKLAKRAIGDAVMNYRRRSAYFLSPARLRAVYDDMLKWKPRCIIGYSSALAAFGSANWDRRDSIASCPIKAVVYTGEPISVESRQMLERFFGAPVVGEYGSLECGVMAYTSTHGPYHVFWDTTLITLEKSGQNMGPATVTCLYRKYTPIIRYCNDDILTVPEGEQGKPSVLTISDVLGRAHDVLELDDGSVVHGMALDDCFVNIPWVSQIQVVQTGKKSLIIRLVATKEIGEDERELIRNKTVRLNRQFAHAVIEQVTAIDSTIAGKRRWIVRLSEE